MKKPTLAEVAQLAEVVAAAAVIVSLVYLAREVRTNTAAIRGASLQAVSNASSDALLNLATDSALSRIRQLGNLDPSRLTDLEAYRYQLFQRQFWLTMQNVYFQNELGVIEPRIWRGYTRIICEAWAIPGVQATWSNHRPTLDTDFAEVVQSCPDD